MISEMREVEVFDGTRYHTGKFITPLKCLSSTSKIQHSLEEMNNTSLTTQTAGTSMLNNVETIASSCLLAAFSYSKPENYR